MYPLPESRRDVATAAGFMGKRLQDSRREG
jgi:hypothetical protein